MDTQQLLSKIKKVGWRSYIYPAISTVSIILLLILGVSAGRFLSNSLNQIFSVDNATIESQLVRVNFTNLNFVANKIGVEIKALEPTSPPDDQEQPINPESQTPPEEELTGPTAPVYETPAPVQEFKASLKIEILNSTKTGGLAGQLKTDLEASGFKVEKVGNISTTEPVTLIKVKESIKTTFPQSISELQALVSSKYSAATQQTLNPESSVDVQIIIGTK